MLADVRRGKIIETNNKYATCQGKVKNSSISKVKTFMILMRRMISDDKSLYYMINTKFSIYSKFYSMIRYSIMISV